MKKILKGKQTIAALAETREQAEALLDTEASLLYIDAGYFAPAEWADIGRAAHAAGKKIGLRFPHLFRRAEAVYFDAEKNRLADASFDVFLVRGGECLAYLLSVSNEIIPKELTIDYTFGIMNRESALALRELFPLPENRKLCLTLSLELDRRELKAFCQADAQTLHELVVYGRVPMTVSAQCVKKTVCGCDHRPCVTELLDRKGMRLPVKNNCTFCTNTVYNAQPAMLFDLREEIADIGADSFRYEFTTESGRDVKRILAGTYPFSENSFTRGHFHRGTA